MVVMVTPSLLGLRIYNGGLAGFSGYIRSFPRYGLMDGRRLWELNRLLFIGMMHLLGNGFDHTKGVRQFRTDGGLSKKMPDNYVGHEVRESIYL